MFTDNLAMKWSALFLMLFCADTSPASNFEACIFIGTVTSIEPDYLNDRKHAMIIIDKVGRLDEFEIGNCESHLGEKHRFSFDPIKHPFKVGSRAEIKWVFLNEENEISGQMQFGLKILNTDET